MYDYDEACPISMAASVLCERWTLQIVREMLFGSTRYSEIQRYVPNISPSLLRNRLRSLEAQGLILRKRGAGAGRHEYFLTPSGKALAPVLTEMGKWGMRWARKGMTDRQNTAWGLVRDFAGRIDVDQIPTVNMSIRFDLADVRESPVHYIHIRDRNVQVCDTDLGFETDVLVSSTLDVMTRVWYGEIDMTKAMRDRRMKVDAAPLYSRSIARWLRISTYAGSGPETGNLSPRPGSHA